MPPSSDAIDVWYLRIQRACSALLVVIMTALVAIVFAEVIWRYFLRSSISWSEEAARFLMLWVAFVGGVLAYVHDEHLGLDIVIQLAPAKVGRVLLVVANLLAMVAIALIAIGGYVVVMQNLDWLSPALDIPYGFIYLVCPLCSVLMLFQASLKLVSNLRRLKAAGAAGGTRAC
jgi:TRAP-type transport system small permease protein